MICHKYDIPIHSKLKFAIIFVLPVTLIIAPALLGSVFSNSVFAFSNKYSDNQRYDSGVRDGNKDCQNGSDTAAYQQSSKYLKHSTLYQQGYDDTVNKCNSTPDNTPDNSQQTTPDTTPTSPDNSQQTTPDTTPTTSHTQPDCNKLGFLGRAIGGLAGLATGNPLSALSGAGTGSSVVKNLCENFISTGHSSR
jgi:hypothetical protein